MIGSGEGGDKFKAIVVSSKDDCDARGLRGRTRVVEDDFS